MSLVRIACLLIGSVCFVLGALPSLWPSRVSVGLSLLPIVAFGGGLAKLVWLHRATGSQLMIFFTLIIGVLSDIAVLALVRRTVRRVSEEPSILRVGMAILLQACVIALLVVTPIQASGPLMVRFGQRLQFQALLWLGVFNLFTGFAASGFLLALFAVLLHKLVWPVLGRLLYSLGGHGVIRSQAVMAAVGTACFVFAFPLMSGPVRSILDSLAK